MTRRIEWLKRIFILVLFFSLCLTEDKITRIQLNDPQEYTMEYGGKQYYTMTVEEDENIDLLIQLNCLSAFCDANLIVKIGQDQKPDLFKTPYCKIIQNFINPDYCVIKKEDIKDIIKNGEQILTEVSCQQPCKYSLNTVYQKRIEYEAEKGRRINIFFNEKGSRDILLKIPKTHSTNMLIRAKRINAGEDSYSFDLYGEKGQKIPEDKWISKFIGERLDKQTLIIPLSKKEIDDDSSFSVVVEAAKNAIIEFTVEINERELKKAEESTYDVVRKNDIQYYTIRFDDMLESEKIRMFDGYGEERTFAYNFLFSITPYYGNPYLYIHYGQNRPSQIDEFQWKSKSNLKQNLIFVMGDELNQIGYNQNNKIFIAVLGRETSAYELKILKREAINNRYNYIFENQQVTGFVGGKKIYNFQLRINGPKRDIYISLSSYVGNSDLFVWIDKENNQSEITHEEINTFFKEVNNDSSYLNQKNPFVGWSISKQIQDVIKIKYDPDHCYESHQLKNYYQEANCLYQIALYGNEESNKYVLGVFSKGIGKYQQLRENQEQNTYIQENNSYFFYQPMDQDIDIEQIIFSVKSTSRFVMFAADREIQNFETKPERDFVKNSRKYNLIQFFKFQQKQISTKYNNYVEYNQSEIKQGKLCDYKYYVQIKAPRMFSVQVAVKIVRKGQQKIDYIELLSGFSQKLIINSKSSKNFKFYHQFGKEQTVIARSNSPIKMYIGENKDLPPTISQNTYDADSNIQSQDTEKRINIKSSLSANESYLYGTVENISDKEILVLVQSQSDTIKIDLNACFEDVLIPDVKRTYFFNIKPDISKEEIYLIVKARGTSLGQKLTGFFKINGKLVGTFKDNDSMNMYKVEQEELIKECIHLFQDTQQEDIQSEEKQQDCQVIVEVQSSQEQRLMVSVNGPNIPSYIQHYGSTKSQLPLAKETRKFLYYIFGDKELILTVQSYSYQVQLLSKIVTHSQFNDMDVSNANNFPKFDDDRKNIQLITKPNLTHQVKIKPETYQGGSCFEGCFLMLSVALQQDFDILDEKVIGNIMKLNISGDKIIDLVDGESIEGTVEEEEMQYYRIYVPIDKFLIKLTPFDNGNPDLFLNKDSCSITKIPTNKEFDLKSTEIGGDFIIVEQDTFKNSKNQCSSSGYYFVGVYGRSKSTYSIIYNTPKHRKKGIAQDVTGRETRLITDGIPLKQIILIENNLAKFTYYSSQEGIQAVQVHISPQPGFEDDFQFIDFEMVIQDKERIVQSNTIAHTKDLYAKSFITNIFIPYTLNVKYTGVRAFKFSVLLKETNTSSIPILTGTVIDEFPHQETSNYVIHVKPQQYVLIQNFNCISDQDIFVYTNPTDMLSQNLNAQKVTRESASNHEIKIIEINQDNQGEIYIQKRANKQSNEEKSISQIQSETFQKDEPIIYNYIQIADSGILNVKKEENQIDVSFKDIECTEAKCYNERGLAISKIEYTLHIGENSKDLQRMTNCLLRESSDLSVNDAIAPISLTGFSLLINPRERKFTIEKDLIPKEINNIYVSVSARVFMPNQNTYRFIYGSQIVSDLHMFEDNSDHNLGFIITICLVSIIILIIIILQQYRRKKQAYYKLKQEARDV